MNVLCLQIYNVAGPLGFFKGLGARVLYSMPATAICWSTYEFFKFILSRKSNDDYRSSVSGSNRNNLSISRSNADKKRNPAADDSAAAKSANIRYVIPKPTTIATDIINDTKAAALHHSSASDLNVTGSQYTIPVTSTSRELPSISGVGVYSAVNMNSIHTERVYDPNSRGYSR